MDTQTRQMSHDIANLIHEDDSITMWTCVCGVMNCSTAREAKPCKCCDKPFRAVPEQIFNDGGTNDG